MGATTAPLSACGRCAFLMRRVLARATAASCQYKFLKETAGWRHRQRHPHRWPWREQSSVLTPPKPYQIRPNSCGGAPARLARISGTSTHPSACVLTPCGALASRRDGKRGAARGSAVLQWWSVKIARLRQRLIRVLAYSCCVGQRNTRRAGLPSPGGSSQLKGPCSKANCSFWKSWRN